VVLEEDRLRRARTGDLAAFNELVLEHQVLVFNLCLRQLGQRQAAEDAAQEAFISAWKNLSGLRGPFRPWLLRIAANACTDELRRRVRRPSSSLDVALEAGVPEPPDEEPLPETTTLQGELRREVEAALQTLPDEQRLAVVLSDLQGLDYAEIAEVMKTSLGTVKSRIARGRARLREVLRANAELLAAQSRQQM
jgi:RNA polymerase sigma-70 factor (ECF subfamily)